MEEINLEKIDLVRERCKVTYTEAKEALEATNGNVVDALVYIEQSKKRKADEIISNKDELIAYIKELINKGNVSRIRIKKGEEVVVDIPVNAGIATGLLSLAFPPLIALGFLTALVTKVTIEITKTDGSVEVVNKIIKSTVSDVKEKVNDISKGIKEKTKNFSVYDVKEKVGDFSHDVKDKVEDLSHDIKGKFTGKKESNNSETTGGENSFTYTVKFNDESSKDDK